MTWAERTIHKWQEAAATMDLDNPRKTNRALVNWCCQTTWHVFYTQTFRTPHSEWAAARRWLSCLAEHRWASTLSTVLYTIEPHRDTRSHHVHALLSMMPTRNSPNSRSPYEVWRDDWRFVKEWCWHMMGKALLLPVVNNDAVPYVVKYVTKKPRRIAWYDQTPRPKDPETQWGIVTQFPAPSARPMLAYSRQEFEILREDRNRESYALLKEQLQGIIQ